MSRRMEFFFPWDVKMVDDSQLLIESKTIEYNQFRLVQFQVKDLFSLHKIIEGKSPALQNTAWVKITRGDIWDREEPGLLYLFQPTSREELGIQDSDPYPSPYIIPVNYSLSASLPIIQFGFNEQDDFEGNPLIQYNTSARIKARLNIQSLEEKAIITEKNYFDLDPIFDSNQTRSVLVTGHDESVLNICIGKSQIPIVSVFYKPRQKSQYASGLSQTEFYIAVNLSRAEEIRSGNFD